MAEMIGSAGTLVAAGLATAGQYLQSGLLDVFAQGLGGALGFLLFIIAGISALTSAALLGRYPQALWLVVGPALFLAVVTQRTNSLGVVWEVGSRVHDSRQVNSTLRGVYGGDSLQSTGVSDRDIRVSWVFAKWDTFTSAVTTAFVRALNITNMRSDLNFLTRTERYFQLFHLKIDNPEVEYFVHAVLLHHCSEYVALSQQIANESSIVEKARLQSRLNDISQRVVIGSLDDSFDRIQKMGAAGLFGVGNPLANNDVFTCPQLWNLGMASLRVLAASGAATAAGANLNQFLTVDESYRELSRKFGATNQLEPGDAASLVNVIGVRMLSNAISGENAKLSALTAETQNETQNPTTGPLAMGKNDTASDLKLFASYQAYRGKGEFLTFMLGLPYLQGIAFYILAAAFPFFALISILPSRMGSLLTWMQMWAWVKSWDLGFALVMLIDEVLYTFLPRGPVLADSTVQNPGAALQAILASDPSYTEDIYFTVVAALLGAIPLLTGLLIHQGSREFSRMLGQGYHNFAGRIGGSFASYAASMKAQSIAGESERAKVDTATAARGQMARDPEMIAAATAGGVGGAFGSASQSKGLLATIRNGLSGETVRYGKQLVRKKAQAIAAVRAWETSLGTENERRAERMVELGFSIHDLADDAPVAEMVELSAARADYRWGGTVEGALRSLIQPSAPKTNGNQTPPLPNASGSAVTSGVGTPAPNR